MGYMNAARAKTLAVGTVLALVMATGTAVAGSDDDPFARNRTDIGFGMLVGGFSVGSIGGAGVGIHLDVGRQMGPLKLFGEYNLLSIGESSYDNENPVRGALHRVGLNARYNFAELGGGRHKPLQGAFWAEAGLGRQHISWYDGGILRHDDVSLGFGAQFNFKIGRHKPRPKIFGFYYAFKATIAESPNADQLGPPTCAGPCDEATAPSPYDLGIFFNMGLNWGS